MTGNLNSARANHTGISITGNCNVIGGQNASGTSHRGNVVSGNSSDSITLSAGLYNALQGNWVGLDSTGAAVLANSGYGIILSGSCNSALIGGNDATFGNVISGNIITKDV